jgi:hypothetical protein
MIESTNPNWVPASLVRVRCFLNRRGMKVKPWLGPDAVLESFYATLRLQTKDDAFWSELEHLLHDLASDMNQRVLGSGWVIENELLDSQAHAGLLAQIREALEVEARACAGLHPLAASIPRRAGALLLMLAAAVVIGCGGEQEALSGPAAGGTTRSVSHGGASSGGATTQSGGAPGMGGSTNMAITLPAMGGSTVQTTGSCPNPDATNRLDPAQFEACNPKLVAALIPYAIAGNVYEKILQCACLLNDAWQTGLGDLFAGKDCNQIIAYFGECGVANLCGIGNRTLPTDFDVNALYDRCIVTVYLGVRCD